MREWPMREWYERLASRERVIVLAAGGILLVLLVYLLAIEPLYNALARQRSQVEAGRELLGWMQQSAAEVRALKGAGKTAAASSSQAPYLILDQAIRRAGLPAPQRIEPKGSDGAQAQFETVDFDKLMAVLDELRKAQGLRVTDASMTRKGEGQVSARVILERGGG